MGLKKCSRCDKKYDDKEPNCPYCRKERDRKRQEDYRKEREDKSLNTKRWRKLREYIISRDGGYCQRCWIKYGIINTECLEVNHIKSRLHFPELTWDEDNLVTLCHTCNAQMGTSDTLDFDWTPPGEDENNEKEDEWKF